VNDRNKQDIYQTSEQKLVKQTSTGLNQNVLVRGSELIERPLQVCVIIELLVQQPIWHFRASREYISYESGCGGVGLFASRIAADYYSICLLPQVHKVR
jgi:hypothetical protein